MMDIKYDFKANPFKEKDGKPVLYPAVVVKETITTDHIVKELSKHSAYSAGCVVGVLQEVADMGLSGNFWLVSFKISYLCLPLFYETRTTPSCHPSGCAYRQL